MRFTKPFLFACALVIAPDVALADSASGIELNQTVDRPLFSKSRRAYSEPVVAAPAPKPKVKPVLVKAPVIEAPKPRLGPSDLLLNGVVQRGDEKIALVEQRATGKHIRMKLGAAEVLDMDGNVLKIEVTGINADSMTVYAGTPLTFMLRSKATKDEINVETTPPAGEFYAALNRSILVTAKERAAPSGSNLMPTAVAQNAGFVVSLDSSN